MDILAYLKSLLAHSGMGAFDRRLSWHGMDILDLRKYQAGDAVRYINRKQTAKHGHAIVNVYEDVQEAWLQCFLDINYNRVGMWKDPTLRTTVEQFLVELLRHAHRLWVRVDVCWYAEGQLQVMVAKDYRQVADLIEKNIVDQKAVYHSAVWSFVQEVLWQKKRRGVLLLSDFLEPLDEDLQRHLQAIFPTSFVALPISTLEGKNFVGL
jgi:hypothetical protein